ncbi:trimethylamine-N-oxide reductase [Vibrio astriarenae]|nr:trimethylamine-N-oxide reductase [Vibrio sp. C7]
MAITRRSFLKGVAGTSAASLIGPSLLASASANAAETEGTWKVSGSHWGAFRARVWGGKVQEIKPLELDKYPTDMLNGIKGIIYSPSRVRYPMVRLDWLKKHKYAADTRGNNRFVRVTWDEALDLFYRELERVQKDYGPWALHTGQTGWRQTGQMHSCNNHMQRAMGLHGYSVKKVGDYSTGAGQTILPYVLGSTEVYAQGTSWELILENSDNIILWGNDPVKNLQVGWTCETHDSFEYLEQLKEKVAKKEINVISVDPVRNKTARYLENDLRYIHHTQTYRLCWVLRTFCTMKTCTTKSLLKPTAWASKTSSNTFKVRPKTVLRRRLNGRLKSVAQAHKRSATLLVC